jgi:hypothetical protein
MKTLQTLVNETIDLAIAQGFTEPEYIEHLKTCRYQDLIRRHTFHSTYFTEDMNKQNAQ